jgi:hypothetical protein
VAAALRCRCGVRDELAAAQRGARGADAGALHAHAATLRAAIAAEASAACDSDAAAAAAAAAAEFAGVVETAAAAAAAGGSGAELRGALFRACDALRGALRAAGVRVEDSLPAHAAAAAPGGT